MKYKKYSYIVVLLLTLLVGMNSAHAESKKCYYMSEDQEFKATLELTWGFGTAWLHIVEDYSQVYIDKKGETFDHNSELLINWIDCVWSNSPDNSNVKFDDYYKNSTEANKGESSCPKYLVFQQCGTYRVWATESESKAQKAVQDINNNGCYGAYGSYGRKDANGNIDAYDSEEYYSEFVLEGLVQLNDNGEPTCEDYKSIFGEKNDPESIRYMLDTILQYVRIIVPILVILLGTLDFAKAVMAGKEDNMKKAQSDFIKRVLIGVAVFFVPLLVDVIMYLADIVWQGQYIHCDF